MKNTSKCHLASNQSHRSRHLAVFGILTLFGVLYNRWIAEQERQLKEGRTSLWVVFGCVVTLIGAATLNWQGAVIAFLCFIASGLPMIIGSLLRFFRLIERAERHNTK